MPLGPGQLNVQAQINSPQGLVKVKARAGVKPDPRTQRGPAGVEILPLRAKRPGVTVEIRWPPTSAPP
jgi:hypothetical protein